MFPTDSGRIEYRTTTDVDADAPPFKPSSIDAPSGPTPEAFLYISMRWFLTSKSTLVDHGALSPNPGFMSILAMFPDALLITIASPGSCV